MNEFRVQYVLILKYILFTGSSLGIEICNFKKVRIISIPPMKMRLKLQGTYSSLSEASRIVPTSSSSSEWNKSWKLTIRLDR